MDNNPDDILTAREVKIILHKSKSTIYSLLKNNSIKAYRSGYKWLIPRTSIFDYARGIYIKKLGVSKWLREPYYPPYIEK